MRVNSLIAFVTLSSCLVCISHGFDVELRALDEGPIKEYVTLNGGERSAIVLAANSLDAQVDFLVLQAHSQIMPVRLSQDAFGNGTNAVTGNNVGIAIPVGSLINVQNGTVIGYVMNGHVAPIRVLVAVVGYSADDPIPGGCNMEFPVAISPFLMLAYTEEINQIGFQRAGYSSGGGILSLSCDLARDFDELIYEVFYFDFPENDVSESTYFSNLEVFVTAEEIRARGVKAMEITTYVRPEVLFNAFPGMGMIYAVLVTRKSNLTRTAAYAPIVTYSCRPFSNGGEDCNAVDTVFSWILCALAIFCGTLLLLRGHRFFKTQLFLMAFAGFSFMGYIFFRNFIFPDHTANYSAMRLDLNYWAVFASLALVVPIVLSFNAKMLSIVSSSVVGSFSIVSAFDRYMGGALVFAIINVVRRAVIPEFAQAYIVWPIQLTDVLLLGTWSLLAVLGIAIQAYFETGRPPFPPTNAGFENSGQQSGFSSERSGLLPDRERLLFPDYESSRPASAASSVAAKLRRSRGSRAVLGEDVSASESGADDPPPPYFAGRGQDPMTTTRAGSESPAFSR
ncbi:unnamed protein product [Notodromas monacha]|uniref:TM7S3/TM198-like domain-containing protein n=1 Tax=Notodromas monacha TaxID=399045 RepID=A0A7R9GI26_9CRUS|nr:unnamed protein product [Notodromas monacha]CAG0921975.1 unnamed protein product [Notodromas monacha]